MNSNDRTFGLADNLKEIILNISNYLGNSLDMLQKLLAKKHSSKAYDVDVEFPSWVSNNDKRLIHGLVLGTNFNLTVAKDGTGNFTTISSAVSAAPNSSETRFMIYIKGGEYYENVEIPKKKTMIMFVGDGIGKTIIKSNLSRLDGWTTYRSATVGVNGNGFIAKDISFVNFAGPSCQDTLYVHKATQFYRECDIFGTVDFICGNAAVVSQNCSLYARKPNLNQKIAFTAQSHNESKQQTGISMINCRILAAPDLIPVKANFKAYLGRPWKLFSRTVLIKSFIDDLIDPAGWLEWENEVAPETLYYGEYMNEGPDANMTDRVKWPGYRRIENASEAAKFTVVPFIEGNTWLNSTNIPFNLGF
ncbi:unnamed protein product [Arabis nemorensis]|uniref:Pectinesterase catalytic domain-containing protein n=1 Tax=Arabis nemorensis TaxID=586526 RepID=A0A565BDL7_9BRAS|nr:unnamed protein product [Arabis nemorensis]